MKSDPRSLAEIFERVTPERIDSLFQENEIIQIRTSHEAIIATKRESEVLLYLISGRSANAASEQMGISPRTVESHIVNLKNKLGCNKISEVIYRALTGHFLENFR